MSSYKRSGQPLRLNANEVTKAIRAGEMLDQLMGSRGGASGRMPQSLMARVKNAGSADIPAWGLCRWFGDPVQPATIGGTVPELVLRTVTDTTRPICVAVNQIKAAASPNPAEIGQVQIMGVCWARCRGPIAANDPLMPDSSFRGVKDTVGNSNVKALAAVSSGTDAIIPVLIGGGSSSTCSTKWQIFSLWGATAGTITLYVGVENSSGTLVHEYIVLNWDDDAAEVRTAFAGHSELALSDVTVFGGMPQSTVTLPAGSTIDTVLITHTLTSNKLVLPAVMVSSCCT